tara:strand:- start:123 stop:881 length:759 start_codon:yes stop_codon:yes gene_type:complete
LKNRNLLCWNSSKQSLEELTFRNILDLRLLYGVNQQIDKISKNTENFLNGLPYNHALLWGVRGSGKSSIIRGVLNDYSKQYENFVTIEINSESLSDLPKIFLNFNLDKKVIIFIDDLSFEQNDRRYIQFKSFLEGSFYSTKLSFLIYVTTNRRHLMKRDMLDNERSSAISQDEGIEEKLSLSDRFGLWISFHNLSKDDFINIVKNYCKYYKISFDQGIEDAALKWIFSRGNRTGRSAYQFFKEFCSIKKIKI